MSKRKKLSDLCYICPRGTREGMPYFFFEKSVFVEHTNVEFSLVMNLERNPTIIYGLLSVLDSDRDDRVVVAEVEELMARFHSFLRGEPESHQCSISLPMLVGSLRRLGISSEMLENILAILTPFAVTLPRWRNHSYFELV